jgi:type I restriction enzyme M protein
VVTLDEVREYNYALTPGRYVGTEEPEDEDEPFEVRMPLLVDKLISEFEKSAILEKSIRGQLKNLDYAS